MKKLEKVLGEAQENVESEYFKAIVKSNADDTESTVSVFFRGGPEKVRGGLHDAKANVKAALDKMDAAFEAAIVGD